MRLWSKRAALIALAVAGFAAGAQAQDFPNRTIRIIVGPSPDAIPRIFSDRMSKQWGTPVIVEPRSGAGGEIAAKAVASADPDGYTLLNATSSFTLNTAMQLATYDFVKDFEPVAMINLSFFVLVVNKSLPVSNLKELIAYAKSKPGELNCGSAGQGTPPHLACEMFNSLAGVKTVHVPFREANAAMNALIGNHVQMSFAVAPTVRGQVEGGTVKALALTAPQQSKLFPGVPTMAEAGLAGLEVTGWGSFMAPARTPKAVVDKLNAEIVRQVADPDVQKNLATLGLETPPSYSAEQFATFIKDDIARWNKIIDTAGVSRTKPTAQ